MCDSETWNQFHASVPLKFMDPEKTDGIPTNGKCIEIDHIESCSNKTPFKLNVYIFFQNINSIYFITFNTDFMEATTNKQ